MELTTIERNILTAMLDRKDCGFLDGDIHAVFVAAGINADDVMGMLGAMAALQGLVEREIVFVAKNHYTALSNYRGKEVWYGIGTVTAKALKGILS